MASNNKDFREKPSLLWPLLLIALGVVLLLSNLNILPPAAIDVLWQFWPLIFILLGLDMLIGRRSRLGAIITAFLSLILVGGAIAFVAFSQNLPGFVERVDTGSLKTETIQAERDGVERATFNLDWPNGPAYLTALSDSNDLLDGQLNYYGTLFFDVNRVGNTAIINLDSRVEGFFFGTSNTNPNRTVWEVALHPEVLWSLELDASSAQAEYDLSRLQVERLFIDASSGSINLLLPAEGRLDGEIDGGSGSLSISLPPEMEARIRLEDGSGSFTPSKRFRPGERTPSDDDDLSVWVTANFQNTDNYVDLYIDQGSGSIVVE